MSDCVKPSIIKDSLYTKITILLGEFQFGIRNASVLLEVLKVEYEQTEDMMKDKTVFPTLFREK